MLKKLQTIFKVFVIIISLTVVSKAELLNPNSNIAPSEVVKIQLTGLQKNDLDKATPLTVPSATLVSASSTS